MYVCMYVWERLIEREGEKESVLCVCECMKVYVSVCVYACMCGVCVNAVVSYSVPT